MYQAEVPFCKNFNYGNFHWSVTGRADVLLEEEDQVTMIEEIKSTIRPLPLSDEETQKVHWAQAMCYGHFYLENVPKSTIIIKLTYIQVDSLESRSFQRTFDKEELCTFFEGLVKDYLPWAELAVMHQKERDLSLSELAFPFPAYREGQRPLMNSTYRTIERGRKLFACAPTGIGKTLSTLFPALKAMGKGIGKRIFYLTAKEITRQVAADALNLLEDKGTKLQYIVLTARSKICPQEEMDCRPEICPYAKGHYDRILEALFALLQEARLDRQKILDYAEKYTVCPFELGLEAALWADVVICDYNYALDPVAKLHRFFSMEKKTEAVLLFDEAHNLVDRARDMFSAGLSLDSFTALRPFFKENAPALEKATKNIQKILRTESKKQETPAFTEAEPPDELLPLLTHFTALCELWFKENPIEQTEAFLSLYFEALAYLRIAELYDIHYRTLIEKKGRNITITLFCIDPSALLQKDLSAHRATIFFSATLNPLPYYFELLGGILGEDYQVSFPSPFDPGHLCLLGTTYISTRYRHRDASYLPIAESLFLIIHKNPGNYLVYFPSYAYLQQVYSIFSEKFADCPVIVQENGMSPSAQKEFLDAFACQNETPLLGFCVLGGAFSEGIDLTGNRLIGSIVVGAGLPKVGFIPEVIKDYYDEKGEDGFAYAYTYPGFNKVLQAAGRVIRTEEDKGYVILLEDRFHSYTYQRLFPPHWQNIRFVRTPEALQTHLQVFHEKEKD